MKYFLLLFLFFSCDTKKEFAPNILHIDGQVIYAFPKSKEAHCVLAMSKMHKIMGEKLEEGMQECHNGLLNVQPDIETKQAREVCKKSSGFQEMFKETAEIIDQTVMHMAPSCNWVFDAKATSP